MTHARASDSFSLPDPDGFTRLREALAGAGYTERGVLGVLGPRDIWRLSVGDLLLFVHATRGGSPLDTLIRLFLIGQTVACEAARQALGPATLDELAAAGLLRLQEGAVAGGVQLLPFRGLVVAFDRPPRPGAPVAADYVMGVAGSTISLANATVRRPSQLTLDLGTGCGILAFLAAPHSSHVLAVDRNPRAVALARFNARLNAVANVECLEGDLFSPVQGREFDLICSNPPFVISPEAHYIYRDSGRPLDEVTEAIVRHAPRFLREGGFCQILCNWAHVRGQDPRERLAAWFAGTGCDAWVLRSDTVDAPAYAARWIRHTERDTPEGEARRFEEWLAYYARHQVEAVSGGLIILRRRSGGANWVRVDDAPEKMLGPAGEDIARAFELRDFLDAMGDDQALLGQRLRVSPDARLHQTLEPAPEAWRLAQCEIRLHRGLTYTGNVDPCLLAFLGRCDGQRPLREGLQGLPALLGEDEAKVIPATLDVVRRLVERGFLVPAEFPAREAPPGNVT